jgi:hypothetical protein
MPKRRRRRKRMTSALAVVQAARAAAKNALDSLRQEIKGTTGKLEKLLAEERRFREELFGAGSLLGGKSAVRGARSPKRRRGKPKAERFFSKLGNTFTLEDVRKLAGRKAGISLAQWSRAKRIRKAGKGYQKVAA